MWCKDDFALWFFYYSPLMISGCISAKNTLCGIPPACKIFTRLRQDVNTVEASHYTPRRYIADAPAQSAIHRWNDIVITCISIGLPPVVYCSHFFDDPQDLVNCSALHSVIKGTVVVNGFLMFPSWRGQQIRILKVFFIWLTIDTAYRFRRVRQDNFGHIFNNTLKEWTFLKLILDGMTQKNHLTLLPPLKYRQLTLLKKC
jgi:hypothetical protein